MRNLFTTFLFFICMTCFSQDVQKRDITPAQIDAIFAKWNTSDKPGIAVGVLSDGKIIYAKGFGLANLEHQIPVSPETRFHIGDLAKEFTVYALLLLEHRGQLSLEDDIREYMPDLKRLPYAISIKRLIHHTSGFNNDRAAKALAGWRADDVFTKGDAYSMIRNHAKSSSDNGSEQRFSDANFMVLEDLISKITKMPYADFVTKEIFEPLKMSNSIFDTQGAVIANKAQGYLSQNNGFISSTMNYSHTLLADVYTTVEDMCLWAKELIDPKIGTKQMMVKFDRPSFVNNKKEKESNATLNTGGHRFWDYRGIKKLYHRELMGGYSSKLIRYPGYNLAIIIMENDGEYNGGYATVASALYIEDFLTSSSVESAEIKSKKLSDKQLAAFEGNYWDIDSHASRKIHIANDTLRYFRGPGNESTLVPLSKNNFKMMNWSDVEVSFDIKSNPKTMKVRDGGLTSNLVSYDKEASWTKNLSSFTGNYYAEVLDTSYSLILEEGKLILMHPRLEPVQLDPRVPNVFTGDQRHFSSLSFKKETNGTVTGFQLATNGVADIWFQKETTQRENLAKTK